MKKKAGNLLRTLAAPLLAGVVVFAGMQIPVFAEDGELLVIGEDIPESAVQAAGDLAEAGQNEGTDAAGGIAEAGQNEGTDAAGDLAEAGQNEGADAAGGAQADERSQLPHLLTAYQTSGVDVWENDAVEAFTMMGTDYHQGLTSIYYSDISACYNLDGAFTGVTLEVGHWDETSGDACTLYIYKDDELSQTLELSGDMITQKLELDVTGVRQLRFEQTKGGQYGYANITGYGGHTCKKEMTQVVSAVNDGIYTATCTNCGYCYEEVIPKQEKCVPYLEPYQSSGVYIPEATEDPTDYFLVMGKPYDHGAAKEYSNGAELLYNLGQQYNSLTFTVGHWDNAARDGAAMQFFGDGKLMKEIELTPDMINQTYTFNTTGITQFKVSYIGWGQYGIFDMSYETPVEREHSFISEVLLEATVGQTGICTYTCANCGASYSEIIPALEQ